MNNAGYGTEHHIQDDPYNDVTPWNYHLLPDVLGAGRGFAVDTKSNSTPPPVKTERETRGFSLIDIRLDPFDRSPALHRSG